jgi:hypothetical protein
MLENAINTEEGKEGLCKYSENYVHLGVIRETAWFHLGFATAVRLFGNSPAMKLIGGGRKEDSKPRPLKSEFKL